MEDILFEIARKKESELGLNGILQLYQMVMHDVRPPFTQGIFLFTEYEDNEISSFKAASQLMARDAAPEVFIIYGGGHGSPGYSNWYERLSVYIDKGRIRPVPIGNPTGINTLSESDALVKFAINEKRKSFYIVAPPFHMLRAFMTAASIAIRHGSKINFFAYPGALQDLNQVVKHSQGIGTFPRWKWFERELKTISDYSEKNGIALAPGIIKYEPIPRIIKYMQDRKLKF